MYTFSPTTFRSAWRSLVLGVALLGPSCALAQAKLTPYIEKLPESVGRFVKPKVAETPAAVAGGSADAPSS